MLRTELVQALRVARRNAGARKVERQRDVGGDAPEHRSQHDRQWPDVLGVRGTGDGDPQAGIAAGVGHDPQCRRGGAESCAARDFAARPVLSVVAMQTRLDYVRWVKLMGRRQRRGTPGGRNAPGTLVRAVGLFAPHRRRVVTWAAVTLCSALLLAAAPLLIAVIFDQALFPAGGQPDLALLVTLVGLMIAAAALGGALAILQTYLANVIGTAGAARPEAPAVPAPPSDVARLLHQGAIRRAPVGGRTRRGGARPAS